MGSEIVLEEEQQLSRKSVKGTVNVIAVILLGAMMISVFSGKEAGRDAVGLFALIFLVLAGIGYLLNRSKLTTQIREDGIYVKFSPFHRRFQVYSWDTISQLYIRRYNGFREFGGWGLKIGPHGSCFSVSGDIGIQLVLSNNSRILIGTQQAEAIAEELRKLGKLNFPSDSFFRP